MKKVLGAAWKLVKWYAIFDVIIWAFVGVGAVGKHVYYHPEDIDQDINKRVTLKFLNYVPCYVGARKPSKFF